VCCIPYVLFSSLYLFFPCGDGTPPSFYVSYSGSSYRPFCMDSMAGSTSCGPFPLDASNYVRLTSSTNCSGSCVDYFSPSTCNVVFSYSALWITSTSTTVGISLVPPCGPRVLLWVLHCISLGAPTHGGDMVVKFKQQTLNSPSGSTIPHSIVLPLDSMFFSLEKITMGLFSPLFPTL
jgi:hypothetical protein